MSNPWEWNYFAFELYIPRRQEDKGTHSINSSQGDLKYFLGSKNLELVSLRFYILMGDTGKQALENIAWNLSLALVEIPEESSQMI